MSGTPERIPSRWLALPLALGLAVLAITALADDAEATHFVAGTLTWREIDTGAEPLFEIGGYLSYDTKYIGLEVTEVVVPTALGAVPTLPTGDTAAGLYNTAMCTAPLEGLVLGPSTQWGDLRVGGILVDYGLKVVKMDPSDHCRFSAQIVAPGGSPLTVPNPRGTVQAPFAIEWSMCCRENDQAHQNNGAVPVLAGMQTLVVPGQNNAAPVIDFPSLAFPGIRSEIGHGNVHCARNGVCNFLVSAADPDGDKLTFRLAGQSEAAAGATNGELFYHPGPDVPSNRGRATGPYSIDSNTGMISWEPAPARAGDVYSTQVIVSDGKTSVPIDFIFEVQDPVEPCEDGELPVINPDTGEYYCPPPPPPPEPCEIPGTDYKDWDGDGDCEYPPKPDVEHPRQEPVPNPEFYLPGIATPLSKAPAVSDGHGHVHLPQDRVNAEIAGLDQDDDGLVDRLDPCPYVGDGSLADFDGDSVGDGCDEDLDGDGFLNEVDPCEYDSFNLCLKTKLPTAKTTAMSSQNGLGLGAEDGVQRGDAAVNLASISAQSKGLGSAWLVFVALGVIAAMVCVAAVMRRENH